jgi:hypothetical protein
MKKRKTRISGEETSAHQNVRPVSGPRCQRATIPCPVSARMPIPTAKVIQKATAMTSSRSRARMRKPPAMISASAIAIHADIGAHQK